MLPEGRIQETLSDIDIANFQNSTPVATMPTNDKCDLMKLKSFYLAKC